MHKECGIKALIWASCREKILVSSSYLDIGIEMRGCGEEILSSLSR